MSARGCREYQRGYADGFVAGWRDRAEAGCRSGHFDGAPRTYVARRGPMEGRWRVQVCTRCCAAGLTALDAPEQSFAAVVAALEEAHR